MRHFSSSTTKKCYGRDRFGHLIPFAPQIQDGCSLTMDGVGGGGGVRDEALSRSSKEATFSEPFYVLKGIQYRVYSIF